MVNRKSLTISENNQVWGSVTGFSLVPCILIYNNDLGLFIRKPFNNRWLKALRAAQNELDRQLDSVFHDITVYAISGFAVNS